MAWRKAEAIANVFITSQHLLIDLSGSAGEPIISYT